MDAGIHCIDTVRFLLGDHVVVLEAMTDRSDQADSVERSAVCRFTAGGVKSFVQVCSQAPYLSRLTVTGTDGEIVVNNFASCWGMATAKLYARQASGEVGVVKEDIVDVSMTYAEQLRNFADAIGRSEANILEPLDAAENVRIVEQLYECSQR